MSPNSPSSTLTNFSSHHRPLSCLILYPKAGIISIPPSCSRPSDRQVFLGMFRIYPGHLQQPSSSSCFQSQDIYNSKIKFIKELQQTFFLPPTRPLATQFPSWRQPKGPDPCVSIESHSAHRNKQSWVSLQVIFQKHNTGYVFPSLKSFTTFPLQTLELQSPVLAATPVLLAFPFQTTAFSVEICPVQGLLPTLFPLLGQFPPRSVHANSVLKLLPQRVHSLSSPVIPCNRRPSTVALKLLPQVVIIHLLGCLLAIFHIGP